MKKLIKNTLFLACVGVSGLALAEDKPVYDVHLIQYQNNGLYDAYVWAKVKNENGSKSEYAAKCWSGNGGIATDANNLVRAGWKVTCSLYSDRHSDKEVWPVIKIVAGDTKSCRKDGFTLNNWNDGRNGKKVKYSTGGTTFNNNRCKFKGVEDH